VKSRFIILFAAVLSFIILSTHGIAQSGDGPIIADHTCTDLSKIPEDAIQKAKAGLHIAYGHTSHGSQLTTGMSGLVEFKGDLYSFNNGGSNGALDLRDTPFAGAKDLGNPDRTSWEAATRNYLNGHYDINVIIWSWCGQAGTASEGDITTYLNLMTGLENDYPGVNFVYMTGHLDGGGLEGNLHIRNEQIRTYCSDNNKILYDFADIESYDPDGTYFGDKIPNDNCDYDSDGNGSRDSNWAIEWQDAHPGEWYNCNSAHSQPLNANRKAYAAWWLWAKLAGWEDSPAGIENTQAEPSAFTLHQNYPNPFNSLTKITYSLQKASDIELSLYTLTGQRVITLVSGPKQFGTHTAFWSGKDRKGNSVTSGIYMCQIKNNSGITETKTMIYLK